MKSAELMIGDWVNLSKGNWSENRQVELADIEMIAESVYLAEPIPITAETLEKNFEKKTFYGIYDDYFDLYIREYSDGLYIVTYHSCEFNIPDQTIHLSWVHELQHFMRHCGIQKTIKL